MKIYNNKKICFIICTNDDLQLQECLLYLSLLQIPEGYETELITITDARSMAAGYNEGMNASDAKYKIYLHQDSFIIEPLFLEKLLNIFKRDKKIGMAGIIGAEKLSKDGVMWHEERCGNFYRLNEETDGVEHLKRGKKEVEVVDGFLMATQYDLPWREDIIKGWDFYDVSQCMEFRRAGYKIVVPAQKNVWVIHACGVPNFWNYNENRKFLLKEYPEITESQPGRLRILFIHSTEITLIGLAHSLMLLGHSVSIPDYKVTLGGPLKEDTEAVEDVLEEGHYDLVVTYDYSPGVSDACHNMGVKYYSWVYDDPLMELYSASGLNDINYISVFDRNQYERLKKRDYAHLFYLPLASEVDIFGEVSIKKRDERRFKSDVSFVGRFYDRVGYDGYFDDCSETLREEADAIVSSCDCRWNGEINLFNKASDELIQQIASKYPEEYWERLAIDKRYHGECVLTRRCNEIERIKVLNRLAEQFDIVLYTDNTPKKALRNVKIKKWVDYIAEMPKVFHLSKINLNITSRSIESGIPQRVWDIMAVGGFCLTNYQPELEEYFAIGEDLDVYHDLDELIEKVRYYLQNESIRIRVAINGYKKVREYHNMKVRMKEALEYIFAEE